MKRVAQGERYSKTYGASTTSLKSLEILSSVSGLKPLKCLVNYSRWTQLECHNRNLDLDYVAAGCAQPSVLPTFLAKSALSQKTDLP
jgi:hypothetical protein